MRVIARLSPYATMRPPPERGPQSFAGVGTAS